MEFVCREPLGYIWIEFLGRISEMERKVNLPREYAFKKPYSGVSYQ